MKEDKIMKTGKSGAVASSGKGTCRSVPSRKERKLVAELRVVRTQAERQMREYDRVMAKKAEK